MNYNDSYIYLNILIKFEEKKMTSIKDKSISDIFKECNIGEGLPISFESIVEKYNINIFATDFDELSKINTFNSIFEDNRRVFGLAQILRENNIDCINIHYSNAKNIKVPVQRYIIAHELGHCANDYDELINNGELDFSTKNIMGKEVFEFSSKDEREEKCNEFARELLIPEKVLKKLLSYNIKFSIKDLADLFLVPKEVMKIRMKELDLWG